MNKEKIILDHNKPANEVYFQQEQRNQLQKKPNTE